ncbi:hypothetical protein BGX24_002259, partial [Mortierella sp. AD032]
ERWTRANKITGFFGAVQSVAWSPTEDLEFVTGCEDHSVRVWRISSTSGRSNSSNMCVSMVWGSNIGQLVVADARFDDATGLSPKNEQLLIQRDARRDAGVVLVKAFLSVADVGPRESGGGNRGELWANDDMLQSDEEWWSEPGGEEDDDEVGDEVEDELNEDSD